MVSFVVLEIMTNDQLVLCSFCSHKARLCGLSVDSYRGATLRLSLRQQVRDKTAPAATDALSCPVFLPNVYPWSTSNHEAKSYFESLCFLLLFFSRIRPSWILGRAATWLDLASMSCVHSCRSHVLSFPLSHLTTIATAKEDGWGGAPVFAGASKLSETLTQI